MKRVAFAHVNKIIDFETYEEAVNYIISGWNKPWYFVIQKDNRISKPYYYGQYSKEEYEEKLKQFLDQYIWHTGNDGSEWCFGDKLVKEYWSVEVNVPYGKYHTGW